MPWKWILYFLFIGIVIFFGLFLFPKMLNDLSYDHYLLDIPEQSPGPSGYPLILFLHGSAERGDDLELVKRYGPHRFLSNASDFPFVLLSPQCSADDHWHSRPLVRLIDKISNEIEIDTNRIYLTGLSMGGTGVWNLATLAPEKFAAIAPICGRYKDDLKELEKLKDLPVWIFHGRLDDVVPIRESERIVDTLNSFGAVEVRFTVYPEAGHDAWSDTYSNEKLYTWLLQHSRI